MDPSIFICSVKKYTDIQNPQPYSTYVNKEETPLREVKYDLPSPFILPLRNFSDKTALLWADIDATFSFTNSVPATFWAFPQDIYPARQAFYVSYLSPQLVGNFNMALWNVPGLEYFAYRRPEYFVYALVKDKKLLDYTPQHQNIFVPDTSIRSFYTYLNKIKSIQNDGLDFVATWDSSRKNLLLALETLRIGGNCCLRVFEPNLEDLTIASEVFQEMYLFKPMLSNPFDRERFLILKGKKENYSQGIFQLEEKIEVPDKIRNWLIYQNNLLTTYAEDVARNKFAPIFPSKCFIKWNLPDLPPPEIVKCVKSHLKEEREESPNFLGLPGENIQGVSKRTDALATVPSGKTYIVYKAEPFYMGGWEFQGYSQTNNKKLLAAGKGCYIK